MTYSNKTIRISVLVDFKPSASMRKVFGLIYCLAQLAYSVSSVSLPTVHSMVVWGGKLMRLALVIVNVK